MKIRSLFCCLFLFFTLGCGVEILTPMAKGNQNVFKKLEVSLTLNAYDAWNYTKKDASGTPSLALNHSIRVRVGDGLSSYQALLRIFVDGTEVKEYPSAGLPQQFSYQHWVKEPFKERSYVLEFRYQNASYFVKVGMSPGEIKSPSVNQTVNDKEVIRVVWVGAEKPSAASIQTRSMGPTGSGGCALAYTPQTQAKDHTVFVPHRSDSGNQLPCMGEAKVTWSKKEQPTSPFGEFTITKITSRIQPFHIE